MANDQAMLSTCYCHQGLLKAAGERHIAARSWPDPLRHRRSRVTRAPVNRRGNQKTPWQFCVGHFMAWSAMEAARLVNADPLAAQYREAMARKMAAQAMLAPRWPWLGREFRRKQACAGATPI